MRIWDRETAARISYRKVVIAEERRTSDAIAAIARARTSRGIDLRAVELSDAWKRAEAMIAEHEFNLVSANEERIMLSPRATEEGWAQRLEADVSSHRRAVTEAKAAALFQTGRELREVRATILESSTNASDAASKLEQLTAALVHDKSYSWMVRACEA